MIALDEEYPFEFHDESVRIPKYNGYTTRSFYITMRDGVQIAADLHLPKGLPPNTKIPTVLVQTRYWRAYKFRIPFKWFIKEPRKPEVVKGFTSQGFAVVWVDVRGTGASFGTRAYPFSEEEIQDGKEVIDWIISQPWSDGNVITYGNSYAGATSELAASLNHPAVKCILTTHCPWDFYLHAVFPGGCFNEKFISLWSSLGKVLDQTRGSGLKVMKAYDPWLARIAVLAVESVKPVEFEGEKSNLNKIAEVHRVNKYPIDYFEKVQARDDKIDEQGTTIDSISTFSKKAKIEKLNIPIYAWGSWQDSTTANMIIHRFLNFSNPQKAVIGDWCHRAKNRANPFHSHKAPADPKKADQIKDWVKFYRDCLDNKFGSRKILYYYTMGEEKWKKTENWPPANQKMIPWYLNENFTLSPTPPQKDVGSDEYIVNFDATTGIRNRWYTLLSVPVHYSNREKEDKKLLCYTSKPLEQDIEITGHPIITLFLKSTHKDGMIQVHLEFIDEKERVHWITDGQLRLIHRKISSEQPPYRMVVPYHSFLRKDILPLVPGEVTEITFALYPTSILLRQGYRIRIAIGGADKDTFARYPAEGTPTISIERNKKFRSYLQLPIIQKSS